MPGNLRQLRHLWGHLRRRLLTGFDLGFQRSLHSPRERPFPLDVVVISSEARVLQCPLSHHPLIDKGLGAIVQWRGSAVVGRLAFARTCSAVLVQTKGWARSFQPLMKVRILVLRSLTALNTLRRMAWRSTIGDRDDPRALPLAGVNGLEPAEEVGPGLTVIRGY